MGVVHNFLRRHETNITLIRVLTIIVVLNLPILTFLCEETLVI